MSITKQGLHSINKQCKGVICQTQLLLKHMQSKSKFEQSRQQCNSSMNDQLDNDLIKFGTLKTLTTAGISHLKQQGRVRGIAGQNCPRG